jgi:hypothetical protein
MALVFRDFVRDRRRERELLAPDECKYCDVGVVWKRGEWIHVDGQRMRPFKKLEQFPDAPKHHATSKRVNAMANAMLED